MCFLYKTPLVFKQYCTSLHSIILASQPSKYPKLHPVDIKSCCEEHEFKTLNPHPYASCTFKLLRVNKCAKRKTIHPTDQTSGTRF